MSENTFEVAFEGRLAEGADLQKVKSNLARLFKTDVARIEGMFSGKRVVIKRGVDERTARNYQLALGKAGAVAEVINVAAHDHKEAEGSATPPSAPDAGARKPVSAADLTMAEPGVILVAPKNTPEPEIDTSGLSVAEPGAILAEPKEVTPPEFDLSSLDLAPPGERLSEREEQPEAQFDTSGLTLS